MKTFHSLEGLRGWLAWWVVIGHSLQIAGKPTWLPDQVSSLLLRGDAAVNVFVIISGFVVTHLLTTRQETYIPYILRRFFRLWPVYLVCMALALATTEAYRFTFIQLPYAEGVEMRAARLAATDDNLLAHLALHATMLHGVIPQSILEFSASSILAPAWSLSLEWQFYMIAPVLIAMLSKRRLYVALALPTAVLIAYLSKYGFGKQYQYPSTLLLSGHFFLIGIASRLALDRIKSLTNQQFLTLLGLGAVFFIAHKLEAIIWFAWSIFVLLEQESLKISLRVRPLLQRTATLITTNQVILTIGKYSYSTYLVHIPIFTMLIHLGLTQFNIPQERSAIHALLAFSFAGVLIASHFLYNYIEKPGIKLGTRISHAFATAKQ